MKADVVVKVELTMQEAIWLKNIMQDPLYFQDPSEEDPRDRIIRLTLFKSLHETLN